MAVAVCGWGGGISGCSRGLKQALLNCSPAPPLLPPQVTDRGISCLSGCGRGLKQLKLNYCVQLTDGALFHLEGGCLGGPHGGLSGGVPRGGVAGGDLVCVWLCVCVASEGVGVLRVPPRGWG